MLFIHEKGNRNLEIGFYIQHMYYFVSYLIERIFFISIKAEWGRKRELTRNILFKYLTYFSRTAYRKWLEPRPRSSTMYTPWKRNNTRLVFAERKFLLVQGTSRFIRIHFKGPSGKPSTTRQFYCVFQDSTRLQRPRIIFKGSTPCT